jgi:hypothetical protein
MLRPSVISLLFEQLPSFSKLVASAVWFPLNARLATSRAVSATRNCLRQAIGGAQIVELLIEDRP